MNESAAAAMTNQEACDQGTCRAACAIEVIDSLLRASSAVRGEEVDLLLDLRWLLRNRLNPNEVLVLFCKLRRMMEERHYLACYRLRRWLENHIQAVIRTCRGAAEVTVPLRLNRYCIEAVRFQCLQSLPPGTGPMLAPRVEFAFRPEQTKVSSAPACALSDPAPQTA